MSFFPFLLCQQIVAQLARSLDLQPTFLCERHGDAFVMQFISFSFLKSREEQSMHATQCTTHDDITIPLQQFSW